MDNRDDVQRFATAFDDVTDLALDPDDTTDLIHERMKQLAGRRPNTTLARNRRTELPTAQA